MTDNKSKDQSLDENSPSIVAYRVGQLEIATTTGFEKLNDKLDSLKGTFTPLKDHIDLEKRVIALEKKNGFISTLKTVGLVLTTVIGIIALYNLFTGGK